MRPPHFRDEDDLSQDARIAALEAEVASLRRSIFPQPVPMPSFPGHIVYPDVSLPYFPPIQVGSPDPMWPGGPPITYCAAIASDDAR